MGRTVIADSEGNGLTPDIIWCAVCKDVDTKEVFRFTPEQMKKEFLDFANTVDMWIGHSFIDYDVPAFASVLGLEIPVSKVTDTLILSRMAKPKRLGGHSIKNWGRILGREKPEHNEWDKFSPAMLHRCEEDVEITFLVWQRLVRATAGFSQQSIRMEHKLQQIMTQQEADGFKLDVEKATKLFATLTELKERLEKEILTDFKPRPMPIRRVEPKITKKGELSKVGLGGVENVEGEFTLLEFEEFNLGSPKQIVQRLNDYGWKPVNRTDGFKKLKEKLNNGEITKEEYEAREKISWKVDEDNLATIPDTAPQSAKNLATWKMAASRLTLVETWLKLIDKDERIHGRVNTIGTWTHRMSHYDPNMANIPGVIVDGKTHEPLLGLEGSFGFECRDCWTVGSGRKLVGVDAKGIQLRAFADYVGDADYIKTVVEGDPHQYHADILQNLIQEEVTRPKAKTFIYAYLLGAGVGKISLILGHNCGTKVKNDFPKNLPGLDDFFHRLDLIAQKGVLVALDGRLIKIPSRHLALAAALQSFEKCIMGRAICISNSIFHKEKVDTTLAAVVHDETQWDTADRYAEFVGNTVVDSIRKAGVAYGTKCPMDGDMKVGSAWSFTH